MLRCPSNLYRQNVSFFTIDYSKIFPYICWLIASIHARSRNYQVFHSAGTVTLTSFQTWHRLLPSYFLRFSEIFPISSYLLVSTMARRLPDPSSVTLIKEGRGTNRINSTSQSMFHGNFHGIDDVEVNIVFSDILLQVQVGKFLCTRSSSTPYLREGSAIFKPF